MLVLMVIGVAPCAIAACVNVSFPFNPQNWSCTTNSPELDLCAPGAQPFCRSDNIQGCYQYDKRASEWFFYLGATVFVPDKVVQVDLIPLWLGSDAFSQVTIGSFLMHPSQQLMTLTVNGEFVTDYTEPYISKVPNQLLIQAYLHAPPTTGYTSLAFGDIVLQVCN